MKVNSLTFLGRLRKGVDLLKKTHVWKRESQGNFVLKKKDKDGCPEPNQLQGDKTRPGAAR